MPTIPTDGEMPEMGEFGGRELTSTVAESSSSTLAPAAYLAMGAGSVILSTAIFYAILSKFFALNLADALKGGRRLAIFFGGSLLLAAAFAVGCYFLGEIL